MARGRSLRLAVGGCLIIGAAAAPVGGAGFSIFEQGAKAMGMAGAFTATADDPSAVFHNVGGLAFFDERAFQAGLTLVSSSGAEFSGAAPFPGLGVSEKLERVAEVPPHFYWVEPINASWTFGFGINAPWGLVTEWDPAGFSGRYISTKGSLATIDISPNLGWKAGERLGVGFGLILRLSEVELRRFQGAINPFTGVVADIARVDLTSDMENGIGWQAGLLHRINNSFSWGFHYKGEIEIDYQGDARFTQVPTGFAQFDAVVAALLPFGVDLPITTTLAYPASWSLGTALALSRNWRMEIDYNWTDWDVFDRVEIDFGGALPNERVEQLWTDAYSYRIGFRWVGGKRTEWRFGYLFDESPQPLETVGPLLPDADRDGLTVGYGRTGGKVSFDLAVMYVLLDKRTTLVNVDGFNGTWEATGLLVGATLGW